MQRFRGYRVTQITLEVGSLHLHAESGGEQIDKLIFARPVRRSGVLFAYRLVGDGNCCSRNDSAGRIRHDAYDGSEKLLSGNGLRHRYHKGEPKRTPEKNAVDCALRSKLSCHMASHFVG